MTTLNEVPEGDTLRRFTKKEKEWNATFDRLGYEVDKTRAVSIISNYTKRVIEYDFINSLNKSKNKTLKIRITELLCKIGAKFLVINYLYNKQIGSGYLILGYVKKSNEWV